MTSTATTEPVTDIVTDKVTTADLKHNHREISTLALGPFEVDLPETVGFYGGIAAALALGMVEPPLAAVIAVMPLVKIVSNGEDVPVPVRWIARLMKGATKPVGSDGQGTIRVRAAERVE